MSKTATRRSAFLATTAAVLALGLLPAIAGAAVLLYEPFNYPDGPLNGQGGWTNHSGVLDQMQVVSGQADVIMNSQSEDLNTGYAARGAADKTYVSLTVTVASATSLASGDYFAHFRSSADFVYPGRIYIGPPLAGGEFTFGIRETSSVPIVWWGSDFSIGSTHQIIAQYDAAAGSATLWVDPVSEASPSIVSPAGAAGDLIDQYALREGSGTLSEQLVDDIVVGETFGDVISLATPTALTSWGRIKAAYR